MIIKIAYKLFTETNVEGMINYPSESIEINEADEMDYISAGYEVDFIFNFEAYKESMLDQFNAWKLQFHPPALNVKINYMTTKKENMTEPPFDVDFVAGLESKLHRKSIIVKGECRSEEYYSDNTNGAFYNLVVKEVTTYVRDALGFPTYKEVEVFWVRDDETFHPKTKKWRSYFSQLEKIKEGKTRRGNLVSNLQMPCIGLISIAMTGTPNPSNAVIIEGRRFLSDYSKEFTVFTEDSNREIISCLSDPLNSKYASVSIYPWIDSMTPYGITIRQFIINEMTI